MKLMILLTALALALVGCSSSPLERPVFVCDDPIDDIAVDSSMPGSETNPSARTAGVSETKNGCDS